MIETALTFINHASVLIAYRDRFLLTDPWYEQPAFGSWLPSFPPFCHPAYLLALEEKLTLLVSHGHDDHCDDKLIGLFDKRTTVVTSDFPSPGVPRRLGRLGLDQVVLAPSAGVQVGPFYIKSFRHNDVSVDDALYTIRTPDALIVHCNDLWNPLTEDMAAAIAAEAALVGRENCVYMSQTNSASGWPLTYRGYDPAEKKRLLRNKALGMVRSGLANARKVGAPYFVSYAGFASPFVKDRADYVEDGLMPTAAFIREQMGDEIPEGVEVLDLYPGDRFDFRGVIPSFLGRAYSDANLKAATRRFYQAYGQIDRCDSFAPPPARLASDAEIGDFLAGFDDFVRARIARDGYYASVIGKSFTIETTEEGARVSVRFGSGLVALSEEANKTMHVSRALISRVIAGEILFENLYTGYNAEFSRSPANIYNRDIVTYIAVYSYVYRNRMAARSASTPQHE